MTGWTLTLVIQPTSLGLAQALFLIHIHLVFISLDINKLFTNTTDCHSSVPHWFLGKWQLQVAQMVVKNISRVYKMNIGGKTTLGTKSPATWFITAQAIAIQQLSLPIFCRDCAMKIYCHSLSFNRVMKKRRLMRALRLQAIIQIYDMIMYLICSMRLKIINSRDDQWKVLIPNFPSHSFFFFCKSFENNN